MKVNYSTKKGAVLLERKINRYFHICDKLNSENPAKIVKPYTLSGLLCVLEMTRAELEELSLKKNCRDMILSAKQKIEAYTEENALGGRLTAAAAANSLKYNFGWSDKGEREDMQKEIYIMLDKQTELLAE